MKQGGGTIDTNALANGRGLSTGSPSLAPVWNSTATVKTSTPTSYIPSYTSWYPTAHQDTMQQPQLMWTRTAKTTPPLYPPMAQFRGPDTGQSLCGLTHTGTPQPRPVVIRRHSHNADTHWPAWTEREPSAPERKQVSFSIEGNAWKVGQIKAATLPLSVTFCCVKKKKRKEKKIYETVP